MRKTTILLLLVLCILTSSTTAKIPKKFIAPEVFMQSTDNVNVVIELDSDNINNRYMKLKSFLNTYKGIKIKHQYQKGYIAATVSKDTLNKLSNDPYVTAIYYDFPVHAFLDYSVTLIEADAFWNISFPANGSGETICIIDTGIDYTHEAFGACNISKEIYYGQAYNYSTETSHPYLDNSEEIYVINYTGFTSISVHFVNISTEAEWDFVKILDPNNFNNTIAVYTGFYEDVWTPSVAGDTIYVMLDTDSNTPDWGFKIDQVINGSVNSSLNWSSCDKVTGGWDFTRNILNGADPSDDHGHGTHVAGIVGSINSIYKGVSPGASIVAVKALNSSGHGTDSDVAAAIEFCTENKERLNISVISMSLGGGLYSDYCDSEPGLSWFNNIVQEAVSRGIMVIAASGNDGSTTQIAFPACLKNITSVGATTDSDTIYSNSNRGPLLDLYAPGQSIRSAKLGGDYVDSSGTSMATPHVAAAAVLLMNFKKMENGSILSPDQVRSILNVTGKYIDQYTNRINLSSALLLIDDLPKLVNTSIPDNNSYINTNFSVFQITASEPLLNATLFLDNTSLSFDGTGNSFTKYVSFEDGNHSFSILIHDSTQNQVENGVYYFYSDTTVPIIYDIVNISLNATIYNVAWATSENASCYLHYGTISDIYEFNSTSENFSLEHNRSLIGLEPNTTYYYVLNCSDIFGNSNISQEYSFVTEFADIHAPAWSDLSVFPINSSAYQPNQESQFNLTWNDYNISQVIIEHNFFGEVFNFSTLNSGAIYYYDITGLIPGNYSWRMHAYDFNGNYNVTPYFGYTLIKAQPNITLTLNSTSSNISIQPHDYILIQAVSTNYIQLFLNHEIINFGYNLSNYSQFSDSGEYNVTATSEETENYTYFSVQLKIMVNDTLAPVISFINPVNQSTLNDSYFILNVSTNEFAYCNYNFSINDSFGGLSKIHVAEIVMVEGSHALTVNCTDSAQLVSRSTIYFNIVDITGPQTQISVAQTTDTLVFQFSTDEESNYSLDVASQSFSGSYNYNHEVTISSLNPGTKYVYSLKLCDIYSNCNEFSGDVTTLSVPKTSSSGGGSGRSATAVIPVLNSSIFKHVWYQLPVGMTTLKVINQPITEIVLNLKNLIQGPIQFSIETLATPVHLMNDEVYKYITINKTLIHDENLSEVIIRFKVNNSYLLNKSNISLWRFSKSWYELPTVFVSRDENFSYFESTSPGLSLFAIYGYPNITLQEPELNTTRVTNITPETILSLEPEEQHAYATPRNNMPIILGIITVKVLVLLSAYSVFVTHRYSDQRRQLVKKLSDYYIKMKRKGKSHSQIVSSLRKAGWSDKTLKKVFRSI